MQETWVRFLGREDPLEKAKDPTPALLPGKSHGRRSLIGYSPWGRKELNTLVAQTVKTLPTMRETLVPSLGHEDPLEKGMATHSSILAWALAPQERLPELPLYLVSNTTLEPH